MGHRRRYDNSDVGTQNAATVLQYTTGDEGLIWNREQSHSRSEYTCKHIRHRGFLIVLTWTTTALFPATVWLIVDTISPSLKSSPH